ncbi:TPA: alanine racemase, partial [Candidatus Sumerlaeota bacterium]|nr:alanine racemase [Candidatus Sumerlaeota bacterium]
MARRTSQNRPGRNFRIQVVAFHSSFVISGTPMSSSSPSPRLWTRVSLSAVRHNFQALKKRLPAETALAAVIKSDAYGHGMVKVARAVCQAGCNHLVVFMPEEAAILREQGFDNCYIITVGPGEPGQAAEIVGLNLSTSIGCLETAQALDAAAFAQNTLARVHLKFDTGMGRFGFRVDAATLSPILDELVKLKNVCIEGAITHLSEADEPSSPFTREQLQQFRNALSMLAERGIHPRWVHAANSAGIVHFPEAAFTLARAGIALYGVYPGP